MLPRAYCARAAFFLLFFFLSLLFSLVPGSLEYRGAPEGEPGLEGDAADTGTGTGTGLLKRQRTSMLASKRDSDRSRVLMIERRNK